MLDQRLRVVPVLAQTLGDHVLAVVRTAAGQQPALDDLIGNLQVDDGVEVQPVGLRELARVAVEHVAVAPPEPGEHRRG